MAQSHDAPGHMHWSMRNKLFRSVPDYTMRWAQSVRWASASLMQGPREEALCRLLAVE
jgi:hypothetical protein